MERTVPSQMEYKNTNFVPENMYVLLDVLTRSIAVYIYKFCCILRKP